MRITRRGVRLPSLLVLAVSCWLVAADAPAPFLTTAAAMVSFLVLLGSFARPPERVGYDLPELIRHYRVTETDVLNDRVLEGRLIVTALMVAFVPHRQREPAWSVPLKSVTRVVHDNSGAFPCIAVHYEDAAQEDKEKRFGVWYDEDYPDRAVRSMEVWIAHVHTRAGLPLPTLGVR